MPTAVCTSPAPQRTGTRRRADIGQRRKPRSSIKGCSGLTIGVGTCPRDGLVVRLINRGTFEVRDDAVIRNANNLTGGQFRNEGTFVKKTGTGISTFYIQFHNAGTVDVQTGTLSILSYAHAIW